MKQSLIITKPTIPAKGGENMLSLGILSGGAGGVLALAISTVSGMTSKTIGLAVREVLVTRAGMNDESSGLVMFLSLVRKSSSVKNTSTSV